MAASDTSRWWLAAEGFLLLSVWAVPWSLGGAPPWTTLLVAALGVGALFTWAVGASRNHRRWGPHLLLALPAAALILGLLQLVPLPPPLLGLLSPPGAELRDFALLPLGLTRWRPITMDAPSTARAVARVVGLGSMALVALELGRREPVRRRLLAALALSGISVAVCGFVHLLADTDSLFGVYRFYAPQSLVTPFGNKNHLAAWLTLTGTLSLGLALGAKTRDAAIGWAAGAFACGVGVFLSYSRGGIGTFVAAWGLVGAAVLVRRGGGLRAVLPWLVIAATIVFAGLLAFEQLLERADTLSSVEKLSATKVELWPMLAVGALHFWPVGMGLGAFELGFTRFQTTQPSVTFTHPENLVLQWLAEVGVPMTLALAAVVVLLLWRVARSTWALPVERTAFFGVVGVLLHDQFDFALELNAVAVGMAITVGVLCATGAERAGRIPVRRLGPVVAVILAAVAGVAGLTGFPTHLEAEARLADVITRGVTVDQVRAEAIRAIDRHPADWVLYAHEAGDEARRGRPKEALAWVNRLLFLRPDDALAHVAAARSLLRLGHTAQALVEFRSAWRLGEQSSLAAGVAVAVRAGDFDALLIDVPGHLTRVYRILRDGSQPDAVARLLKAAEFAPLSDAVHAEARALRVLHAAEAGDAEVALSAWEALPEDERSSGALSMARARALSRLGRVAEAEVELERLCNREPGNVEAAFALAGVLEGRRKLGAARQVLGRIRAQAGVGATRARTFEVEARTWQQEQRWPKALEAWQTASRIEPQRADLHYRMAEVYEAMGSLHPALDEVRRGRLLDTAEGAKAQDAWVARLEQAQATMP